tara:strand:+ start:222146 stop:222970 length:825 start_codon:yes stop_codon:yes gene_type:complete
MNLSEVRKTVSTIKAQLFKNSNSFSIGMLKSHFRGSGLQFKEHRVYEAGDDVRFIDWKMLAKTNRPYLKTFEEERNVEISVIIDICPTMFYGADKVSKLQVALEIVCLLNILSSETSDYIHPIIIADKIYDLPKASGEKGIVNLITQLEKIEVLNHLGNINYDFYKNREYTKEQNYLKYIKRNREVVVLSDMYNLISNEKFNQVLSNPKTHCFRITSPIDREDQDTYLLSTNDKIGGVGYIHKSDVENNSKYPKKIKNIKVEDKYLELFVREMI